MQKLGRIVSTILWSARYFVFVAVIASIVLSAVLIFTNTQDAWTVIMHMRSFEGDDPTRHIALISHLAGIVDGYLFASILIIFGFGLYQLFIGKFDVPMEDGVATNLLVTRSIDDLKERLAKVVFLILVVRYFEFALEQDLKTPLELLYLAIGIALIGLSIYLTTRDEKHSA